MGADFKGDYVEVLLAWEALVEEYEQTSGQAVGVHVKTAVLIRTAPDALKEHLHISVTSTTTYQQMRQTIMHYVGSTRNYSQQIQRSTASSSHQGPSPMEIGGTFDGGKKGKKGKHNKGKDGKGKTQSQQQAASPD